MNMRRAGQFSSEHTALVLLVGAALAGMSFYVQRALSGKWRQAADTFGHGRQYEVPGRCPPAQVLCSEVTMEAKYGGDRWDADELCPGVDDNEDPCDPENHCWAGDREDRESDALCGSFTGYGSSAEEAAQKARNAVTAWCGPGRTGCQVACAWAGQYPAGVGRQKGPTGYLCVRTVSSREVCAASCG